MKIRIQDDSVRFRITLSELQALVGQGRVAAETRIPGPVGGTFTYAIEVGRSGEPEGHVRLGAAAITLVLTPGELAALSEPDREGVYLRHQGPDGHRFLAFVEKDRPAAVCDKPEAWIYDHRTSGGADTRPIPQGGSR